MITRVTGRLWIIMFIAPILLGAGVGFFVMYPINEFVFYHEHEKFEENPPSAGAFVWGEMRTSLRGESPQKTIFYMITGAILGFCGGFVFNALHRKTQQIQKLQSELENDLEALIRRGESQTLEFKSSFRWDYKQAKVNKALMGVVLKTLAGFMNGSGGSLLIGVADNGEILGLQKDLENLKRKDLDGFEQGLMGAIADKLGTDACRFVNIMFHSVNQKDVCRVLVSSATRPIFFQQEGHARLYLRTGGGTRELDAQEAIEYTTDHWS